MARPTREDAIHTRGRGESAFTRADRVHERDGGRAGRARARVRRAGRMPIARASVGDGPREHGDVVEAHAHAVTDREPQAGAVLHVHA